MSRRHRTGRRGFDDSRLPRAVRLPVSQDVIDGEVCLDTRVSTLMQLTCLISGPVSHLCGFETPNSAYRPLCPTSTEHPVSRSRCIACPCPCAGIPLGNRKQ
jgi:hypothetical protein